ncbi:hypothetical protein GH714_013740 [Hevea brasiliensis]|uniref:Leucine-rich repeat-containing N-terminal plant-type domain-containing protein n=1 Tax=Hevea brasiliensis TaxID=3981 RepID=A0A6A6MA52_HEVBR|nr:hypothetical protein GH714_013740 [Hevea brasiliensis]
MLLESLGALTHLKILHLSWSNFEGTLFNKGSNVTNVKELYLDGSSLDENFLQSLEALSSLKLLSLVQLNCTLPIQGHIPNWIGEIPLGYVLLSHNHFEGEIPLQLCKLDNLHLIDLSHNNLSGHIPYCLRSRNDDWLAPISSVQPEQPVEFTTKNNFYFYQPRILRYFSGIDLSCNSLTGEIPPELEILA